MYSRKLFPALFRTKYPTQFLVIIICFTYACITPFILPVGAIFFFFALIVYKKQALYVYTPTYESGGILFPQAVRKTIFALIISQMTFIGYTLIRRGVYQARQSRCLIDFSYFDVHLPHQNWLLFESM